MNLNLTKIKNIYTFSQLFLTIIFIFSFILISYNLFNSCFNLYQLNIDSDLKISKLLNFLLYYTIEILSLIFIVKIIKTIISKWSVNPSLLISLDKNEQLNPILCRKITCHLRYNKNLNYDDLIYYINESNQEKYFLHYHKKSQFNYFLQKYDTDYPNDLK